MRAFYQAFPIWNALCSELSWTHYRTLFKVESDSARQWYMNLAAIQNWSTRALERQIGTLYYERLLASQDRAAVEQEAASNLHVLGKSPREFVRDPVLLKFLGLPNAEEGFILDVLQNYTSYDVALRIPSLEGGASFARLLRKRLKGVGAEQVDLGDLKLSHYRVKPGERLDGVVPQAESPGLYGITDSGLREARDRETV